MIREGEPEVTLKYLADSPTRKLAINSFTEGTCSDWGSIGGHGYIKTSPVCMPRKTVQAGQQRIAYSRGCVC